VHWKEYFLVPRFIFLLTKLDEDYIVYFDQKDEAYNMMKSF